MDDSRLAFVNLGRKGFTMYQMKDGFRFGTDTVLLAWFVSCYIRDTKNVRCLELGSNCGAATLLTAARKDNAVIDSLEIDEEAVEVLGMNIASNNLEDRVHVYHGDVRDLPGDIRQKQYDIVFMNPPFYKEGTGPSSNVTGRSEINGTLEDFISSGSSRLIPSSGMMCVVMTARRTDELMSLMMKYQVKPMSMIAVHSDISKNAEIVLVAGKKTNSFTQLEIMPPLVLNDKERMNSIYEKEHTDCFI